MPMMWRSGGAVVLLDAPPHGTLDEQRVFGDTEVREPGTTGDALHGDEDRLGQHPGRLERVDVLADRRVELAVAVQERFRSARPGSRYEGAHQSLGVSGSGRG